MRNRFASLFGAEVRISLAKHALTIIRMGAFARGGVILLDETSIGDFPPQMLLQRCRSTLAETSPAGLSLSVILSDDLVRLFMVTPPQNAARLQDLIAAANLRFQSLYGEAPHDWQVDANWQTGAPFLACAVPRALVEECRNLANDMRMPLVSLQPHFVASWNAARRELMGAKDHAWLGVLRGHNLSLGIVTAKPKQRLNSVRTLTIPAGKADFDWLQEQLTRAAMQAGVSAPNSMLLAGDARSEWTKAQHAQLKVTCVRNDTAQRMASAPAPTAEATSA